MSTGENDLSPQTGRNLMKERADVGSAENSLWGKAQLPPLFWVRDQITLSQEEPPTQTQTQTQSFAAFPLQPSFSDLKESDNELSDNGCTVDEVVCEDCFDADSYNSDRFEWIPHPCSPENSSRPLKRPDKPSHNVEEVEVIRLQEEEGNEGMPSTHSLVASALKASQTPQLLQESARSSKRKQKEVKLVKDKAGTRSRQRLRRSDATPSPIPLRKLAARSRILKSPRKLSCSQKSSFSNDSNPKSSLQETSAPTLNGRSRRRQLNANLASSSKDGSRVSDVDAAVEVAGCDQACVFCGSAGNSEVAGALTSYKEEFPWQGVKEIHVHKFCIEWAPDVYFEDDKPKNLACEISRGNKIKCSSCGKRGAALGCCDKRCKKSYHYPCGRATTGCKWDENDFVMFCPHHADCTFPKRKRCKAIPSQKTLLAMKNREEVTSTEEGLKGSSLAKQPQRWCAGPASKWVLCGSGLNSDAKAQLVSFASRTGASITEGWSPSVTHVVMAVDENGAAKRTFKFLLSTLLGKWIVTTEWMQACQGLGHPIAESDYEVMRDVKGFVRGPQRGRENAAAKRPRLLQGLSFYFCGEFKSAVKEDLQSLIASGGGVVLQRKPLRAMQCLDNTKNKSRSTYTGALPGGRPIVIYDGAEADKRAPTKMGDSFSIARQAGCDAVPHSWLLDSVASFSLQPIPRRKQRKIGHS